jgi:hypothetical protein
VLTSVIVNAIDPALDIVLAHAADRTECADDKKGEEHAEREVHKR